VNTIDTFPDTWLLTLGPLLILSIWTWVAVRTAYFLRTVTSSRIPYSTRAIWLIKALALILSVGNLIGWALQVNLHLYIAAVPAVGIIYFAFTEQVQQIIPPKPAHHPASYQQALENYREARTTYLRSYRWFGLTFAGFVIVFFGVSAARVPDVFRGIVILLGFVALILSSVFLAIRQHRWLRWPCPRCGCSFRGFWPTPWMPKKCAYCGLPKETFQVAR
jgi:hypothetical protein